MARNIDRLAQKLGARVVERVPEYSAGAFGIAGLAQHLRARLEPGQGKRPGRPSDSSWKKRPKVPMSLETERRLRDLASRMSDQERQVSPMQVAAEILEVATASFFSQGSSGKGSKTPD